MPANLRIDPYAVWNKNTMIEFYHLRHNSWSVLNSINNKYRQKSPNTHIPKYEFNLPELRD